MRISPKRIIKEEGQDASKIGQIMILNDELKILPQMGYLHQLPQQSLVRYGGGVPFDAGGCKMLQYTRQLVEHQFLLSRPILSCLLPFLLPIYFLQCTHPPHSIVLARNLALLIYLH